MYINSFVIFLTLGKHSYRSFRHSLSFKTGFFIADKKPTKRKMKGVKEEE